MNIRNRFFMTMSLFGSKGKTYNFKLGGLTCSMCVKKVTETVNSLDGVKKVRISADMKELTVTAKLEINPADVVKAIQEKGYQAESRPEE